MTTTSLRRAAAAVAASCLLLTAAGCSTLFGSPRDDNGVLTASATIAPSDLKVGDCLEDVNALPESVQTVPAVPCSTSHNGEVFYVTTDDQAYDDDWAEEQCLDAFESYVGIAWEDSTLDGIYFNPTSSDDKDKTLTCIIYHKDGSKDESSLKGSAV